MLEEEGGVQGVTAGVGAEDGEAMGITNFEADGEGVAGLDEAEGDGYFLEVTVGSGFVEGEVVDAVGGGSMDEVGIGGGGALGMP